MTRINNYAPFIRILETRVDMVKTSDIMGIMDRWINDEPERVHHVVNTGMHGIMEAHKDSEFGAVLKAADLLAPDGILAILVARLHGFRLRKQDTGPDLLWRFSELAERRGYRYYFFGDTSETLERLSSKLTSGFPNLNIVGYESPPFRPQTTLEDHATVAAINEAKPDVLWVSLGMPKQEQWISSHRDVLQVPVVVGAGAAFKFVSGTVRRAPAWICNMGLEWLWRLAQEPTRIYRRVLLDAPWFAGLVLLQLTGLRKFD